MTRVLHHDRDEFTASAECPSAARVVVIGGGLTGLVTAHRLLARASRSIQVVVLEASERIGGALWTEPRDGFLLEHGADAFITAKPWAVDLCQEMGLGEGMVGTDPRNRRSFVVRQGCLAPVPEGFVLLAPSRFLPILTTPVLSLRGKLRAMLDMVLPSRLDDDDEDLAAFAQRRLGREVYDRLVQPLLTSLYAADPAELSVAAILPRYRELERSHGGLIRGGLRWARKARSNRVESGAHYGFFVAPGDGMGSLPMALARGLPRDVVRTRCAARRVVAPEPPGFRWRVELLSGPAIEADAVVLATEAHAAARLIDGFDPALALSLRSVPYVSTAVVSLAYRRDQVAHPLDGFGFVTPTIEGRSVLATSFLSIKFPGRAPTGTVLLRTFFGGAIQPELFEQDDHELISLAQTELAELIGLSGSPLLAEVARHYRRMPLYTLGHLERVSRMREQAEKYPGLILAGNYLEGIGIPDCVRSGHWAAEAASSALLTGPNAAVA